MLPTVFQPPEIRDGNDNIVRQGAFGKNSPLSNSTNDGWIDYVANDLNFLYELAKDEVVPVASLPASGDMNKTYLLTTTGVCYRWDGTAWVEISSSEAVGRAETAANLAEQWATKTDGSVADNEYSAKYYANAAQQSADDAQDVADDMADHLAQIDQNTGGVSANSKRIGNIEKLLQGNLYDYDTDDDTAYVKTVPAGALPYAGLEKIGGKTVVWNQLANFGKITFTGAQATIAYPSGSSLISGHKYFYNVDITSTSNCHVRIYTKQSGTNILVADNVPSVQSRIFTSSYNATSTGSDNVEGGLWLYAYGFTEGDVIDNIMLIDLTLLFGSGNEPTSVSEFEQMFPASYYAYDSGSLLSAGVDEVVSKDANDQTIATYPIPADIQSLTGYGWSAGSVYNYVDFENKKFVQNVGRVDLGTLTWKYNTSNTNPFFVAVVPDIKSVSSNEGNKNVLTPYFERRAGSSIKSDTAIDKAMNATSWEFGSNNHQISIVYRAYTDATAFKTAMNGVMLYYELETPIETDISEYLTDDNLINVEAGGTLTFPNQNGTDYQIPVPSEEEYMIDLQEALS